VRKPSSRLSLFAMRFARADRGVTAVEFALVSLPILMMVFGLLELALVFLVGTTLDSATQRAARQIRTGEFQTGGASTAANFKTLVCSRMAWLAPKCANDLWLDVRTFANYGALANPPPIPPTAFKSVNGNPPAPPVCFATGQPADIVLVRAYFRWDLFTPLLDKALDNTGSGQRLITSTTAFRNEPYNNNPPIGASTCP
jgi:Flp pilus assembly protein TadG